MTHRPAPVPTLTDQHAAADALTDARTTMARSRRAATGNILRSAFVYWGVAWMIGYTVAQYARWWVANILWLVFVALSFALTRAGGAPQVRGRPQWVGGALIGGVVGGRRLRRRARHDC